MNAAAVRQLAAELGVPEGQVARDLTISHVLFNLDESEGMVFFGGTALCRTHLPWFRLSEDIDLLVDDTAAARELVDGLPKRMRRHYPAATIRWERDGLTEVARLNTGTTDLVKVQLVPNDAAYRRFPTQWTAVDLRYGPLPKTTTMTVPTPHAFAAMKLKAWTERFHPRDLADLHALHSKGWLTEESVQIADEATPAVQPHAFTDDRLPSDAAWTADLGAQMKHPPDRQVAFITVRAAVARLKGWSSSAAWTRGVDAADDWAMMERSAADLMRSVASSHRPTRNTTASCGAITAAGRPCRNAVTRSGERCHLHR